MRFFVSEIRNAGLVEQSAELDPQVILGEAPEFTKFGRPLKATVTAQMTQTEIVVTGHAETIVGYVCARCLENFERAVSADFQQVFGLDLQEFDVTSDIREAVYIDLPLTPVCKESCLGLCPTCGKNKNMGSCLCKAKEVNTRPPSKWDVLEQFRSQIKRS